MSGEATQPRSCFVKDNIDVVVVGAGASGVAAASKLYCNGFHKLTILEAQKHVGGRISTIQVPGGIEAEEGATWVHGTLENPIVGLAEKSNVKLRKWNYSERVKKSLWLIEGNGKVSEQQRKLLVDAYLKHIHLVREFETGTGDGSKSAVSNFAEWLQQKWEENLFCNCCCDEDTKMVKSALRIFYQKECCDAGLDPLTDCPVESISDYCDMCGGDAVPMSGYARILDPLLKDFPSNVLKLGCVVNEVEYEGNAISNEATPVYVTYSCEKEEVKTIKADHVIITVPLGCLKANGGVRFKPELSEKKQNAIERTGFGTINKIILRYDTPFWPAETKMILLLWKSEMALVQPDWAKGVLQCEVREHNGIQWLETWLTGEDAKAVEYLSTEMVGKTYTEIFRKFTCDGNISLPNFVHVSKWHSNPFFRGSYSYTSRANNKNDIDRHILAEPISKPYADDAEMPKVLFAGEATIPEYFGSVQGALYSGEREADRILKFYESINS
ncbi:spermine oxidase-like [Ciona intestinalis]